MSMYGLKEMVIIALLSVLAMTLLPEHFWLVMGGLLAAYAALSLMSARAFRRAVDSGMVREPRTVEGSRKVFFVAPGCPCRWLVKRHIRVFS